MRFKLLAGKHVQTIRGREWGKDGTGNPVHPPMEMYEAGGNNDIIVSDTDLAKLHNQPGAEKFQRIYEDRKETAADLRRRLAELEAQEAAAASTAPQVNGNEDNRSETLPPGALHASARSSATSVKEDDLENMTMTELRRVAQAEAVDLSGMGRKDQVIAAIRESRDSDDGIDEGSGDDGED